MLMECLSVGRAISLPAIGTTAVKGTLRTTSAYARIRRQFGLSIGQMEGLQSPWPKWSSELMYLSPRGARRPPW